MAEVNEVLPDKPAQPHTPLDRRTATLASKQHGVVTRDQLHALGLSRHAIAIRIEGGRLHRLHRGVYAVGHRALTWHGHWLAAALACGPGAVVSHLDGGALFGIWRRRHGPIHVTVPTFGRRSKRGIRIHATRHLPPEDRTIRHGIPVTSVPRTLLDMAADLSPKHVESAYGEAQRLGLLNARALATLLERASGRPGASLLAELLAQDRAAVAFTRSELEALFLPLCRNAGLPTPLVNVRVAGYEVDMFWPAARLVVELDGFEYHKTRLDFERDRARDVALRAAGFTVVRLTHRMLTRKAGPTMETIASLVAASDRSAS